MPIDGLRVGIGYDVHPFCEGRPCVLGGVEIPHPFGLQGHSDADVLLHAIIDSLLGAASLGDIGKMFPDGDKSYLNISSLELLERVNLVLREKGVCVINIDSIVICEEPKIALYVDGMKKNISRALGGLEPGRIGVKGKTTEKLGFTGRKEGIAAEAVALVELS